MSILGTIMGWFGGKKQAPPELPALPALPEGTYEPEEVGPPPSSVPIDFVAVLAAAGVEADVRDRVVKAKQLLHALPPEAPHETKRQVVEAAFQAFEIPTQKIIDGAAAEIAALRSFIQVGEEEKTTKLADGERHIAELEGQIQEARETMARAVTAQDRRKRLTSDEINTVEPIVQFFAHEAKLSAAAPKPSKKAAAAKAEAAPVKAETAPAKAEAAPAEDPFAEGEYGVVAPAETTSATRSKLLDIARAGTAKQSA